MAVRYMQLAEPQTRIINHGLICIAYGWDREFPLRDGRLIPVMHCLGIYRWEWTARLRCRRWLRQQRALVDARFREALHSP